MALERTRRFTAVGLAAILLTVAGTAFGQQDVPSESDLALLPPPAGGEQGAEVEELERRIGLLVDEVERLRSGEPEIDLTDDQTRARGLAPSAATIYRRMAAGTAAGRLMPRESAAPTAGERDEAEPEPVAAGAGEPESALAPPPPAAGGQETDIEELERRIEHPSPRRSSGCAAASPRST